MDLLINKAYVSELLQVAIGRKEEEFNNYIREAQTFIFKPLFRPAFFSDMMEKIDEEKYSTLLTEANYIYNSHTYNRAGLKQVLAHMTYGLYIMKSGFTDTSFGFVAKTNPGQSEIMSFTERKDWNAKYTQQAMMLFEEVQLFITRFPATYPLWFDGENLPRRKSSSHVINKDGYDYNHDSIRFRKSC